MLFIQPDMQTQSFPSSLAQSWQGQRTLEVLSSLSYRTGELNTYLQLIANSVSELIGLDWAVVTLCRDGFERVLASSIDMGDEANEMYELHGTLTGTVIKSGRCLFVEDTQAITEYGEPPEGYRAYLGAPLRTPTGQIIGTICSFHKEPRQFTVEEMRLVEIFAERAATAIDNYSLYQQQQALNAALQQEISEREEAEQALRKSEEQLRQIAENLQQVIWMYSATSKPIYISPVFESVWGMPCHLWYENPEAWQQSIHPEDRDRVLAVFGGGYKQKFDIEYRIIRPDGCIRIIRDQAFPIVDSSGAIYRIAGIAEDITERKQEQERTFKALERLSEIGELAATIVHEVRNPLTTVLMGLNFFNRIDLPDVAKRRLALALDEAERLKRLLNGILLYAKHEVLQITEIELNSLITELVNNISNTPAAISKQIFFNQPLIPLCVHADKDKLTQVIINLLANACEAISEGERVNVELGQNNTSKEIFIKVTNGGVPIPSEILPRLTKPFYTTKPSGNGLGLAIVKKIVEAHQGSLTIESSAEIGTIVSVKLPMK